MQKRTVAATKLNETKAVKVAVEPKPVEVESTVKVSDVTQTAKAVVADTKEAAKETGAKVAAKVEEKKEAVKAVAKSAAAKKKATKSAEKEPLKPEVFIQFQGREAVIDDVVSKATAQYVAEGHRASSIKSLQVYLKPEDYAAYYVINQKFAGKIDLF